jgi:hypothetical protein
VRHDAHGLITEKSGSPRKPQREQTSDAIYLIIIPGNDSGRRIR